jgi:hypothetical protein
VAIGTIGAVGYALFRDLIVTPRRRPKLELAFDPAGTDRVVVGTSEERDTAHVRLRVTNRPGKDTADDVVVMVTEVRGPDDGETKPIGLPLTWWSGSSPTLTVASVHPASERHVNLLTWSEDAPPRLAVGAEPAVGRDTLDTGTSEIAVEVRARNADAIRYVIPVSWDGGSSGEAAPWDHLRVEPPRRVR